MSRYNDPQLVSIESVFLPSRRDSRREEPYWKVMIACTNDEGMRFIETTWFVSKDDFDEEQIVPVARSYMARMFEGLVEQIKPWIMTPEAHENAKRKPAPLTPMPGAFPVSGTD